MLCNCDDPFESNFFKYFALNFEALGLKKLTALSYSGSPIVGTQLPIFEDDVTEPALKVEITTTPDLNNDGAVDLIDVKMLISSMPNIIQKLDGNGDFRSPEAIKLLMEADIVVTNPPFSLFREFFSLLMKNKKKFIILGNQTAVSYKEVWPLLYGGEVWLGTRGGDMSFRVPDYYEPRATRYWEDAEGNKWRSFGNICWFTNLDHAERHVDLPLFRSYDPIANPKFDLYQAVNVDRYSDVPKDYFEPMAVPLTFLNHHNPEQFEILDANELSVGAPVKPHGLIKDKDGAINGKPKFVRIVIRRRT